MDAVTIAPRFVRFLPSLAFLLFFLSLSLFFPFFSALLYSPAGEIGPGLFSFRVYLISRAPSQLSFFSLILRCVLVAATPVLPSLLACSSIPVPWDLARERLSSYIEKSSGREKNWRYLYHPLCFSLPLLSTAAERTARKNYVFN